MGTGRGWILLAIALGIPGCATYRFAPPYVELHHVVREGDDFNVRCGITETKHRKKIKHSIQGAADLIDNFLYTYRCAARQVADGRQHFEVPGMLIGLGGAVAAAAGAPAAVALGTGAAVAGLNGAKGYYAPKDKLPIFAASIDALVCVKDASVGVDAYGSTLLTKAAKPDAQGDVTPGAAEAAPAASGTQVAVSATEQYYEMVEGALLAIENITAQRLSSVGSYSPDAIVAEFKSLQQKQADEATQKPAKQIQADAQGVAVASEIDPSTASAAAQADVRTVTVAGVQAPVTIKDSAFAGVANVPDILKTMQHGDLEAATHPDNAIDLSGGKPKLVKLSPAQVDGAKAKKTVETSGAAISSALLSISQLQTKLDGCVLRSKL